MQKRMGKTRSLLQGDKMTLLGQQYGMTLVHGADGAELLLV